MTFLGAAPAPPAIGRRLEAAVNAEAFAREQKTSELEKDWRDALDALEGMVYEQGSAQQRAAELPLHLGDLREQLGERPLVLLPEEPLGAARVLPVCFGGTFAASRAAIRSVPRATWAFVAKTLDRGDSVQEGHFAERAWAALLGPDASRRGGARRPSSRSTDPRLS